MVKLELTEEEVCIISAVLAKRVINLYDALLDAEEKHKINDKIFFRKEHNKTKQLLQKVEALKVD